MTRETPRVTVFGPSPILSITIERRGDSGDEIHVHAGGQGVWVARMIAEMEALPIHCAMAGGEIGDVLVPLLERMPGELRLVRTAATAGSWIVDRRSGERVVLADRWSEMPTRHELDDLFSIACAAAFESDLLVVCGSMPGTAMPLKMYGDLVTDARAAGTPVIVDLGASVLESALRGAPDIVHVNDWQLAEFVEGPVSSPDDLSAAVKRITDYGVESVVLTRGAEPAFVFRGDRTWELVPPRIEAGWAEGSGDSMVGALAASLASGVEFEQALKIGAAAGAANVLRHGLGSADRTVIDSLVERVELRPV